MCSSDQMITFICYFLDHFVPFIFQIEINVMQTNKIDKAVISDSMF